MKKGVNIATKDDLVISIEGIGSAGKTTQGDLLAANFWKKYRIAFHKVINRKLLQNTLEPLSQKQSYKFWVANLHYVEIGTDLLAFTALMNERYFAIRSSLSSNKPYIVVLERYVDTVFAYTAARFALKHIAESYKIKSFAPEDVAMAVRKRAEKLKVPFESLVDKAILFGLDAAQEEIDRMYKTFKNISNIVRWPDLTIVLDVPVKSIKSREIRRENRAYTIGDVLLSGIVAEVYKLASKKERTRIYILNGDEDATKLSNQIIKLVKRRCNISEYKK